MKPCFACGAPNSDDKIACYSCGQSLNAPPPGAAGQMPPPSPQQPYPPQVYPQQPYPQPLSVSQPSPQQVYAPPPGVLQENAPQQPYPPQPYAQPSYPQQPYPQAQAQPPYPPQSYPSQPYPPQAYPGAYPPQAALGFSPAEQARAAQIKTQYKAITRYLLLAVFVTCVLGGTIAYALKGGQAFLGIPNVLWACLPVGGLMAYAVAICRCPGCKASLMMKSEINETGECPSCGARLK